jgi:hypothetical protein
MTLPTPCKSCKHCYGKSHGGNLFVCGMHPCGPGDGVETCADWEKRESLEPLSNTFQLSGSMISRMLAHINAQDAELLADRLLPPYEPDEGAGMRRSFFIIPRHRPTLDRDEIFARLGLDPNFQGVPGSPPGRSTGETTNMLIDAAVALQAHRVCVIGWSASWSHVLTNQLEAICDRVGIEASGIVRFSIGHNDLCRIPYVPPQLKGVRLFRDHYKGPYSYPYSYNV